jgi:hypothetical protein
MRKPVLIGGGLGVVVLAVVAAVFWNVSKPVQQVTAPANKTVRTDRPVQKLGEGAALPAISSAASGARNSQEAQDRRRRLAEVRAEFNALRAQGAQASPEKMRALVDELEAASPPGFDPRYFQALRSMLDSSAKLHALNAELQGLGKSTTPKDLARKEALLAEMRAVGEQVSADAASLQNYVPSIASAPAAPPSVPRGRTP